MESESRLHFTLLDANYMLLLSGIIGGVMNGYYRAMLSRTTDITYWVGPVLLADIVELNIGILVACMPAIQPAIFGRVFQFSPEGPSLKRIISRLSLGPKTSSREGNSSKADESGKPYLETRILGNARGRGKFMSTVDNTEIGHLPNRHPQAETRMQTNGPGEETMNDRSWFRRSFFAPWGGWDVNSANLSANMTEKPLNIGGTGKHGQRPSLLPTKEITVTTETFTSTESIRDGQDGQPDHGDDVRHMV